MNRAADGSPSRFASRIAFHIAQADSQGLLGGEWNSGHLHKQAATAEECYRAIAWEILFG